MYDLVIIGAGSAGLPAGIYASRYKLKNIIIGELLGGALTQSHCVENYPGFEEISGSELMNKFLDHAKVSGSEVLNDKVIETSKKNNYFQIKTLAGKEIESKFILIASGNKYRNLKVPGEQEFIGKGVSYCATCDGMFFRGREVIIVGGGNTALTEALYLSEICKKIYIVHRGKFKAEKVLIDRVKNLENIEIISDDEVKEVKGQLFVEEVLLKSGKNLNVDGIFVAIGNDPETNIFQSLGIKLDELGYIIVDSRQETSTPGVYAAGDITTNSNKFQQTLISSAEGALAANSIHEDMIKNM